eukprot:Nk52_evm37s1020 gene=Nk52_evmTU37s1020
MTVSKANLQTSETEEGSHTMANDSGGYVQEKNIRKPGVLNVTKENYHQEKGFLNVQIDDVPVKLGDEGKNSGLFCELDDIAVKICPLKVTAKDNRILDSEVKLKEFFRLHNAPPRMEMQVTGVRKEKREAEISRFDPSGFRHSYSRECTHFVKDFCVSFDLSPFVAHESGESHPQPITQKEYALFKDGSVQPRKANAMLWGKKALLEDLNEKNEREEGDRTTIEVDPDNNVFLEFLERRCMTKKTLTLEKFVVWDFDEVEEEVRKFFKDLKYSGEIRIDFGKKRHIVSVEREDGFYNGESTLAYLLLLLFGLLFFPITIPTYVLYKYHIKRYQDIQIYSDFDIRLDWKQYCNAVKLKLAQVYADSRI